MKFLTLNHGSNLLEIASSPYQYLYHPLNVKGNVFAINCSHHFGSCDACSEGQSPKRGWLVIVYTREGYQVLDMIPSIFSQIQNLTRNPDWGDPSKYAIDIVFDKYSKNRSSYHIIPLREGVDVTYNSLPLSLEDNKFKKMNEEIIKLCSPISPVEREKQINQAKNHGIGRIINL